MVCDIIRNKYWWRRNYRQMNQKIKLTKYEDKNRKYIMYMLFSTVIFLGFAILGIQIIDINSINSLPILND